MRTPVAYTQRRSSATSPPSFSPGTQVNQLLSSSHVTSIRVFRHRLANMVIIRYRLPHPRMGKYTPCSSSDQGINQRMSPNIRKQRRCVQRFSGKCHQEHPAKQRKYSSPSKKITEKHGKTLHRLCVKALRRKYRLKLVTVFLKYYRSVSKKRTRNDLSVSTCKSRCCDKKEKPSSSECREVEISESAELENPYRPVFQWSPSETDQIFVSHSEEDYHFAHKLVTMMESRGLSCFLPERDLPSGPVIDPTGKALVSCRRVLLLLTRHYLHTRWCLFELQMSVWLMYNSQRALIVPFIIDDVPEKEVPPCLRTLSCVDKRDPNYKEKLVSILKGPEIPVTELMPIGNVSQGLAWAYYLRYLKFILPGLEQRIDKWCSEDPRCVDNHMPRKLYILVPASCYCPGKIESEDGRIQFCGHLESVRMNSAGSIDRSYDLSVWTLQQANGQRLQFVAEYTAIVDTLYKMEKKRNAGLDSQLKSRERDHFVCILNKILQDEGLNLTAKLVYFKDTDGQGKVKPLSDILAKHVDRDRHCTSSHPGKGETDTAPHPPQERETVHPPIPGERFSSPPTSDERQTRQTPDHP